MAPVVSWPRPWLPRSVLLPGLGLLLLVVLTYQPVWHAGYVWDDDELVTANPCVVGPLGLKEIWTTKAADICPLTITTFWAEHQAWGVAPLPYHLVTVLLHAVSALLLWRILVRLAVPGAWLGASFWALHPVQVESVAWIAEMKNTQSGVFYLLSVFSFLWWLRARKVEGGTHRAWAYALTLLCAALALASKSSTVVLPLVLCLVARWQEGRWNRRTLIAVIPVFLMSVTAGLVSLWTQRLQTWVSALPEVPRSWPQRLLAAGDVSWFYLGKLAWPHPLITIYPRWKLDTGNWLAYLPLLAGLALLTVLWFRREQVAGFWWFVLGYFLVALLPVLGLADIVFFRLTFVADHFLYLASMGPLALAGAGVVWLMERGFPGRTGWLAFAGAGSLMILADTSWHRAGVYESQETLWTDTVTKNPNSSVAYNMLGVVLKQKGRLDEAIIQYQAALRLNPANAKSHNNLGTALRQKRSLDEAIAEFQNAVDLAPGDSAAHNNLGAALGLKGRSDEAVIQFQEAARLAPENVETRYNLGSALLAGGHLDEAILQYQRVLKLKPDYSAARNALAGVLLKEGRVNAAVALYQEALKATPADAGTHYNLGNLFLQLGRLEDAGSEYQEALKINPRHAPAHGGLGVALFKRGQVNEAIAEFQEAIRLDPEYTGARNNLAAAQAFARQAAEVR